MQILHWPNRVNFLAFDVDDTVYPKCEKYVLHQRHQELQALSDHWGVTENEASERLSEQETRLKAILNRKPSAAEVIRSFEGLSQEWLMKVRCERWRPDLFLRPYPGLPEMMSQLAGSYRLGFASTSPREIILKVFGAIGFESLASKALILGGGDTKPKPAPDVYQKLAEEFGLPPEEGLSVGDRIDFDAYPARSIGMGAVVVNGMEEFVEVVKRLLQEVRHD